VLRIVCNDVLAHRIRCDVIWLDVTLDNSEAARKSAHAECLEVGGMVSFVFSLRTLYFVHSGMPEYLPGSVCLAVSLDCVIQ
jgi:hypothetical protein